MSTGAVSQPDTLTAQPETRLKRNALGLIGAMMLGVVIMAPALAIYTNWGFMIPYVGRGTSVVFVISLIMSIPTAYSYAVLSGRMPNSGSAYKWTGHLLGSRLGIAAGICAVLYYGFMMPYNLPALALLVNDLARSSSSVIFGIVLFGSFALAIPIMLRGVAVSIRLMVILCSLEAVILSIIAIAAFAASSSRVVSFTPLNPGHIHSFSSLTPALVLGVLSFTGFDAVSTVAEETRTPRRLVPRATILALIVTAVFWVLASGILSDALSPAAYDHVAASGGFPLSLAAQKAFGSGGRDIIDVMGIEAEVGLIIASGVGATRILFALGRDGVISRRFGQVHPKFRTPWHALGLLVVFTIVVDVCLSFYLGLNYNIALWISNLIVFFALITYLFINICNPVFFLRRAREEFHWLRNGLVPLFGIVVTVYFLYEGFFHVLWNGNYNSFGSGRVVVLSGLILLVLALVVGFFLGQRRDLQTTVPSLAEGAQLDPDVGTGEDAAAAAGT